MNCTALHRQETMYMRRMVLEVMQGFRLLLLFSETGA